MNLLLQRTNLYLLSLLLAILLSSGCGAPGQSPPSVQQPPDPPAAQDSTPPPTDTPAEPLPTSNLTTQPITADAPDESLPTSDPTSEPLPTIDLTTEPVLADSPTTEAPAVEEIDGATYPLVDTSQTSCFDVAGSLIDCPAEGAELYGQDAQFSGPKPSYTNHNDGTITDNVTGLMWQQSPDINDDGSITVADKLTYDQAQTTCDNLSLGGYSDWRLPDIKQLYSLTQFTGMDISGYDGNDTSGLEPFIATDIFDFAYGDTSAGERLIDAQYASSTLYVGNTANDNGRTLFGVNFADGRIKGYGLSIRGQDKTFLVHCMRGQPTYGQNQFVDNGDGTISDTATGLTWQQTDSGTGLTWAASLAYCQQLTTADFNDWRLPNAKELQSLVDYSRAPAATNSAAIDPVFTATAITNEAGQPDYPAYWSSTTHRKWIGVYDQAVYITFGRAMGYLDSVWQDVHGAGAQRSDPKAGDPANYSTGHGPQGDAIRINNYARCVRAGDITLTPNGDPSADSSGVTNQDDGGSQSPSLDQQNGGGMQPPQEAITACEGQNQGAVCQITAPHGEIDGTCSLIQQQLTCIPAGGPPDTQ